MSFKILLGVIGVEDTGDEKHHMSREEKKRLLEQLLNENRNHMICLKDFSAR